MSNRFEKPSERDYYGLVMVGNWFISAAPHLHADRKLVVTQQRKVQGLLSSLSRDFLMDFSPAHPFQEPLQGRAKRLSFSTGNHSWTPPPGVALVLSPESEASPRGCWSQQCFRHQQYSWRCWVPQLCSQNALLSWSYWVHVTAMEKVQSVSFFCSWGNWGTWRSYNLPS